MSEDFVAYAILTIVLSVLCFLFGSHVATTDLKQEAINRDYALYCPKDGEFAWKGECDE